jgi:hypothetical protein
VVLRAKDCRWWAFHDQRFAGRGRTARRASTTVCVRPPSWKVATTEWSREAAFSVNLGAELAPGRYAVRIRVQRGRAQLAERVAALVVR